MNQTTNAGINLDSLTKRVEGIAQWLARAGKGNDAFDLHALIDLARRAEPSVAADERADFEAHYRELARTGKLHGLRNEDFVPTASGNYLHMYIGAYWHGWQARAALASPAVSKTWTAEEIASSCVTAGLGVFECNALLNTLQGTATQPAVSQKAVAMITGSDTVIGRESRGLQWVKGISPFDYEPGTKLYAVPPTVSQQATPEVPTCAHVWNDFGQLGGRNVSWCPRCDTLAWTGKEPAVSQKDVPEAPATLAAVDLDMGGDLIELTDHLAEWGPKMYLSSNNYKTCVHCGGFEAMVGMKHRLYRAQQTILKIGSAPITQPAVSQMDGAAEPDAFVRAMNKIAQDHAHGLALELECILYDYSGKWCDSAMAKLSAYREAMNAIHERESPTHMGEPVLSRPVAAATTASAGGDKECTVCGAPPVWCHCATAPSRDAAPHCSVCQNLEAQLRAVVAQRDAARAPLPDDDAIHRLHKLREEVAIMYQMLDDGEWAEHIAVTPEGQNLETAISKLVGKVNAASAPLPGQGEVNATQEGLEDSLACILAEHTNLSTDGIDEYVPRIVELLRNFLSFEIVPTEGIDPEFYAAPAQAGDAMDAEWAVKFIEQRAEQYLQDHADTEPDTGALVFEFGEAGRDYHSTLVELADDLRAAMSTSQDQREVE